MKLIRINFQGEYGEKLSVYNLEIHPDMIDILKDLGIIENEKDFISVEDYCRIKKIMRIKNVFGVNINGAAIITELLDRIENMHDEIKRLERDLGF